MVTIKQIAERAGVSTATVSNVIHGKSRKVSAKTVERIQALIDEMGYVQEKREGLVRSEGFKLVAVIIHCHHVFENTVLADPFYGVVIGSIEDELRRQNCYMMLYASTNVEDISRMLVTCNVDGVITLVLLQGELQKAPQPDPQAHGLHRRLREPRRGDTRPGHQIGR